MPPDQPEPPIREVSGDAFFLLAKSTPEIPLEKQRPCPQCGLHAWADSRWCWNCRFDFERATMRRWHPTKLLWLSVLVNLALSLAVLLLLMG